MNAHCSVSAPILTRPISFRSQDDELVALNECLQLAYHQACRDHMILVYPREILILDLAINQTVGIIPLERTASTFVQVRCCKKCHCKLLLESIILYCTMLHTVFIYSASVCVLPYQFCDRD